MDDNNLLFLKGYVVETNSNINIRITPEGKKVTSFTMKVKKPQHTYNNVSYDFFKVEAWGKLAEFCCAKLNKGMKIRVEGSASTGRRTLKSIKYVFYKNNTTEEEFTIPEFKIKAQNIYISDSNIN